MRFASGMGKTHKKTWTSMIGGPEASNRKESTTIKVKMVYL